MLTVVLFVVIFCLGQVSLADGFFGFGKGERGSGDPATEERDLESFSEIRLEGSADLSIAVGGEQSVTVTTDDNLLDNIVTEVTRRGILVISSEGSYRTRLGVQIEITVPHLEELRISGSGDVEIEDLAEEQFEIRISGSGDVAMEGEIGSLEISINGSGNVDFDGTAQEIDVSVSGSGDVDLRGEAVEMEITINGSGDVDARRMITQRVEVDLSGSGDVRVHATDYFDGASYGSGDIDVYGDPEDFTRYEDGSGDIRKR